MIGLSLVVTGLSIVALLAWLAPSQQFGLFTVAPLLAAGIGGGMVIAPNTTLSLECVPPRMAGVAGGALQTAQRGGTAIGTAVLAGIMRAVVASSGGRFSVALAIAMVSAVGFILVALALAIFELRARRARHSRGSLPKVTLAAPSE